MNGREITGLKKTLQDIYVEVQFGLRESLVVFRDSVWNLSSEQKLQRGNSAGLKNFLGFLQTEVCLEFSKEDLYREEER